jgi:transcriptional regulator with XRE-family HTH domain
MGKIATRVDEYVGERIRARRTELGLTQEELANSLKISYQQVQKYETGANRVSAGRLFEIAQRPAGRHGLFLRGAWRPAWRAVPLEHGGKNRSTIELVRNFSDIEDTTIRSAVAGLIKSIASRYKDEELDAAATPQQS